MQKIESSHHVISALARGLDVLACFDPGDSSLSNQQIADRCNLPKSTVVRITDTLVRQGYLVQIASRGQYALGAAVLSLGRSMRARMRERDFVRSLMQELADFSGATVVLGVRDRISMICADVVNGCAALGLALEIGVRLPITSSAMGRAYLAAASERERDTILHLASDVDESAVERIQNGIDRGMQDIAQYGCATSIGEWRQGVNGAAIIFRSVGNFPLYAIGCGGPASRLPIEFLLNEVRSRLLSIAHKIELVSID